MDASLGGIVGGGAGGGALEGGGRPAPYGQTCTNCVRAKCRCIYRITGPDCERCYRLGKECVPSVSLRRKSDKRPNVSRAAQLEEKLEDLVSMLRDQKREQKREQKRKQNPLLVHPPLSFGLGGLPDSADNILVPQPARTVVDVPFHLAYNIPIDPPHGAHSPATPSQQSHDSTVVDGCGGIFVPAKTKCTPGKPVPLAGRGTLLQQVFRPRNNDHVNHVDGDDGATPTPTRPQQQPHEASRTQESEPDLPDAPICEYEPTPLEAEEKLELFRTRMLICFPFMHLPSTVTAQMLRELCPFLRFNIMTVTCTHVDRQLVMSDAAWKFLAQKMVIEHEKSMDLLWGLIVLMGWAQFYRKEKPYSSLLASLVKSLVYDFCLNKSARDPALSTCSRRRTGPLPARERTVDEKRALLACFYLTSQTSHVMKRVDALTWTPYMGECLESLSQQPEWDGDELLVALVKHQLLVEQLTRAVWQSSDGVAPLFLPAALRSQLNDLRSQLPVHVQQNPIMISHLSATELAIAQTIQAKPKAPGSFPSEMQQLEALESSLQTIKKWFDTHLLLPSCAYPSLTFIHWCKMVHCFASLTHLAFEVENPSWDRRAVMDRIDIFGILDKITQRLDEVSDIRKRESVSSMEEDMFTRFARLLRKMKRLWLAETINSDQRMPTGMCAPPNAYVDQAENPWSAALDSSEAWMVQFFEMDFDP